MAYTITEENNNGYFVVDLSTVTSSNFNPIVQATNKTETDECFNIIIKIFIWLVIIAIIFVFVVYIGLSE